MSERERGSEIVQAVIAIPLVLLVLFAVIQVGIMMLSINRLTADMVRACRQMDTAGLAVALDKEAFVATELLGASTQLQPELLHVSRVSLGFHEDEQASKFPQVEKTPGGTEAPGGVEKVANPALSQRTNLSDLSFDVTYEIPLLAHVPGLARTTISRHLECAQTNSRIIEVEVTSL